MRREERRLLKLGFAVGVLGALARGVYLTGIYVFGASLTPRPVAESTPAPSLIKDALWARADGGRATELGAVNPISMAGYIACNELGKPYDSPQARDEREAECVTWLPALPGLEYLSGLHLKDHQIERNSFRGGSGAMFNTVWLSRSWTREEFLNTLAARAQFGYEWRGVEAAAQGFFGQTAAALTLPQAAFLASRVGDTDSDPWCEPDVAAAMRDRILEKMRINGAITDSQYQGASASALELASPPPAHRCS